MSTKRTSTPSYEITLPFSYTPYVERFFATFKQGSTELVKTEADVGKSISVEGDVMVITLTQEETQMFVEGSVEFEIKLYTANKRVVPSDTALIRFENVLNEELFT